MGKIPETRAQDLTRSYVEMVTYRYLDCGILHNGFARVRCKDCAHEYPEACPP